MKRARARVARAMMTTMRVAGKEEGKGGKATTLGGEQTATCYVLILCILLRIRIHWLLI